MKDDSMKMLRGKKYWSELDTKGKVSYFLQYYKWPATFVLFALIFVLVTVSQVMSAVKPDMLMFVISDSTLPPQNSTLMQQEMKPYVHDINADGKTTLKIMPLVTLAETDPKYNADIAYSNNVTLSIQTGAGYPLLFVLSPDEYKRLSKEVGYPFKNVSLNTNKSVDGKAVLLKDTKLFQMAGFSGISGDYLVCMLDKTSNFKGKRAEEMQKFTEDAFYKLIQ